jgi:elongation factor Ts
MESSTSQNADDTVQALEKEAEANDKEPESTESSLSQSVDDSVTGSGTRTRYIFPRIA